MSVHVERFPFVERAPELGAASLAPVVPLTLAAAHSIEVSGLLDTGATVNVLPFSVGNSLGLDWSKQTTPVKLSGNLAMSEARAAVLVAKIGGFAPVRLVFAWCSVDTVPLLLGQVNFFLEFDVCFFRARRMFELRLAEKPAG
jgi:predicted aspartyl protease